MVCPGSAMMKWARDVCVPRNGTSFGLTGRRVPYPFLFWISDGDRFLAEVMYNVQICVLQLFPSATQYVKRTPLISPQAGH